VEFMAGGEAKETADKTARGFVAPVSFAWHCAAWWPNRTADAHGQSKNGACLATETGTMTWESVQARRDCAPNTAPRLPGALRSKGPF
jgi:hypothetical protein